MFANAPAERERAHGNSTTPAEYEQFLTSWLEDGADYARNVFEAGADRGLNDRGLRRAADRLGIVRTGEMAARLWSLPSANGELSEWSHGSNEEDTGPGVPLVPCGGPTGPHTAASNGNPRRGPGERGERGANGATYRTTDSHGRLLAYVSRRCRSTAESKGKGTYPEGFEPTDSPDPQCGSLWRWTGRDAAPSKVKSTFGVCWLCGWHLGDAGYLLAEIGVEGNDPTHTAICGVCPESASYPAPAPTPDTRYWDAHEWLRLGDWDLPNHGCTKDQPLSVGARLGAIADAYQEMNA